MKQILKKETYFSEIFLKSFSFIFHGAQVFILNNKIEYTVNIFQAMESEVTTTKTNAQNLYIDIILSCLSVTKELIVLW